MLRERSGAPPVTYAGSGPWDGDEHRPISDRLWECLKVDRQFYRFMCAECICLTDVCVTVWVYVTEFVDMRSEWRWLTLHKHHWTHIITLNFVLELISIKLKCNKTFILTAFSRCLLVLLCNVRVHCQCSLTDFQTAVHFLNVLKFKCMGF